MNNLKCKANFTHSLTYLNFYHHITYRILLTSKIGRSMPDVKVHKTVKAPVDFIVIADVFASERKR